MISRSVLPPDSEFVGIDSDPHTLKKASARARRCTCTVSKTLILTKMQVQYLEADIFLALIFHVSGSSKAAGATASKTPSRRLRRCRQYDRALNSLGAYS